MRPSLNVLSEDLVQRVLDETKRILSEIGMEIRGSALRQRLLDHGLKADDSGQRVASGVYLYRMQAGSYSKVKRMLLLK